MKKTIFKDQNGDIHFGVKAPEGFLTGTPEDVDAAISNLGGRKFWRCNVCNDLSISLEPPRECPTCQASNAYVEIELNEFQKLLALL